MAISSYLRSLYVITVIALFEVVIVGSLQLRFGTAVHRSSTFQFHMSVEHFDYLVLGGGSGTEYRPIVLYYTTFYMKF